jgi:SAM-dependent methyltransferase
MESREYWDKKIISWEDSWQGTGKPSLIERIGGYFRKPLAVRSELAAELLIPRVRDKRILELGAGSGHFAFELFEKGHPSHYTCLDISDQAVKRATHLAREKGLADNFTIDQADIATAELPEADITIGLGFLDYLSLDEIRSLFARLESPKFLFSVPEPQLTLYRLLHVIYMKSQNCPKHFYFSKQDIRDAASDRFGPLTFVEDDRLGFAFLVHNLT